MIDGLLEEGKKPVTRFGVKVAASNEKRAAARSKLQFPLPLHTTTLRT